MNAGRLDFYHQKCLKQNTTSKVVMVSVASDDLETFIAAIKERDELWKIRDDLLSENTNLRREPGDREAELGAAETLVAILEQKDAQ